MSAGTADQPSIPSSGARWYDMTLNITQFGHVCHGLKAESKCCTIMNFVFGSALKAAYYGNLSPQVAKLKNVILDCLKNGPEGRVWKFHLSRSMAMTLKCI